MAVAEPTIRKPLPFDAARLDALLDDAGIDVLIATSKHNVQYLLGGYRFFFFETMDAVGVTRYLPALVYRKGKPESAAYVGCAMETYEEELGRLWPATLDLRFTGSVAAMQQAVAHIKKLGDGVRRVGIESAFIPADAEAVLHESLVIRERKQPDDWVTFHTRSLLGGSLLGQKRYADAEPLLLAGSEGVRQRAAKR